MKLHCLLGRTGCRNAAPRGSSTSQRRVAWRNVTWKFATAILLGYAALASALPASTGISLTDPYQVREFREIDRDYVTRALQQVNDLAGQYYGERLTNIPERDIGLLQRLLDDKKVAFDDLGTLQALGVALGEVLRQQRDLVWVRYVDGKGVSRALQLKREPYFLYPVTAISRRTAVGAAVDVQAIYQRALAQIDAYVEQQRDH